MANGKLCSILKYDVTAMTEGVTTEEFQFLKKV